MVTREQNTARLKQATPACYAAAAHCFPLSVELLRHSAIFHILDIHWWNVLELTHHSRCHGDEGLVQGFLGDGPVCRGDQKGSAGPG